MNKNLESLCIPYVKELSQCSVDEVINMIEDRGVRRTIDSLNWSSEFPYHPLTTISLAHTDDTLYIDFFVRSNYLRAMNYQTNDPVEEDSSVAVYLKHPESTSCVALLFNCIGTVKGAIVEADGKRQLIDPTKLAGITRYASCGTRPFNELEGLFTWNLLVEVPLDLIGVTYAGTPVALKGNFYKCASGTSQPHYLSWMPVHTDKPSFSRQEYFGDITLI
jgi:hypothetical protein